MVKNVIFVVTVLFALSLAFRRNSKSDIQFHLENLKNLIIGLDSISVTKVFQDVHWFPWQSVRNGNLKNTTHDLRFRTVLRPERFFRFNNARCFLKTISKVNAPKALRSIRIVTKASKSF